MKRYLFEYEVKSEEKRGEFSIVGESEREAEGILIERVADLEFTEVDDIEVVKLIKVQDAEKQFFECEGCQ